MIKKLALVLSEELANSVIGKLSRSDADITVYSSFEDIKSDFDFIVTENNRSADVVINLHYSLLPAFDCDNPIKEAFLSGVKVSGITITNNKKIIAQYPVLIGNDTHYDEFESEIRKTGQLILPIVVDKIIKDEVFDFVDLLGSGCSGCGKSH